VKKLLLLITISSKMFSGISFEELKEKQKKYEHLHNQCVQLVNEGKLEEAINICKLTKDGSRRFTYSIEIKKYEDQEGLWQVIKEYLYEGERYILLAFENDYIYEKMVKKWRSEGCDFRYFISYYEDALKSEDEVLIGKCERLIYDICYNSSVNYHVESYLIDKYPFLAILQAEGLINSESCDDYKKSYLQRFKQKVGLKN
jgi:hypothetical protein